MCAGHPNGVGVTHMAHVPMLLQVGELDTAFDRHKITAEYHEALQARKAAVCGRGNQFESACLVHCGRGHSQIADWRQRSVCVADTGGWLSSGCAQGGGGPGR
jgi:hypothetical protein